MKKQSASLLLSACLFLSVLLLLTQGYLQVYERQMRTLQLAKENYQVESLIALAQARQAKGEKAMWYNFNIGRVHLTEQQAQVKLNTQTQVITQTLSTVTK